MEVRTVVLGMGTDTPSEIPWKRQMKFGYLKQQLLILFGYWRMSRRRLTFNFVKKGALDLKKKEQIK